MQSDTSAPDNLGYTFTDFDLANVTKVEFLASNTNGINVTVSISIDGGVTWISDELFTLTTTPKEYTYNVPLQYQDESNVRVKFTVRRPDPEPTAISRLYIDDVKIYGLVSE